MELKQWINKHNFEQEVERLFDESIICYKAEAYRASLLFSYLGFMTILKNRILNSDPPTGLTPQEWRNGYQNEVRKEGAWDKKVFDCTQQKNKVIFDLTDDLREQVKYWKNRRNDCAHAKAQIIKNHHVESFWTFMFSNISKFFVGGSFEYLINKIDSHFNPNLTPLTEDYSSLIKQIEHGIEVERLSEFFNEAEKKIIHHSKNISAERYKRRHVDFWNKVFVDCNDDIKNKLVEYLKKDNERLEEFIEAYPNRIQELKIDYAFAKNFWLSKSHILITDLNIIASFVRQNIIRPEDYNDLVSKLFSEMYIYELSKETIESLDQINYFEELEAKIINGNPIRHFEKGNRLRSQIIYLIERDGFTEKMTRTLVETFNQDYIPYYLQEDLIEFFKKSPKFKQEFLDKAKSIKLKQPRIKFWE